MILLQKEIAKNIVEEKFRMNRKIKINQYQGK
jgi:hypothetical protein